MNNKGLLGEGLSTPVIFVAVILIMALFVFISAGELAIVEKKKDIAQISIDNRLPVSYDPLFSILSVPSDNGIKKMLTIQAMKELNDRKISQDVFESALQIYANVHKECIILSWADGHNYYGMFIDGNRGTLDLDVIGQDGEFQDALRKYSDEVNTGNFAAQDGLTQDNFRVTFFGGKCK